jgi:hypothetical protein
MKRGNFAMVLITLNVLDDISVRGSWRAHGERWGGDGEVVRTLTVQLER